MSNYAEAQHNTSADAKNRAAEFGVGHKKTRIIMTNDAYTQSSMKYDQITGNKKIDRFICCFFEYVCEEDQRKFTKKFRELPSYSDQTMHTLRELIIGAHLRANGFQVRHDYDVDNKTPDWCILSDESAVIGIVELMNFHIDKATEIEIRRQCETKVNYTYWRDGNKDNVDRLYQRIEDKAQRYRSQAISLKVPYVVAVFGEWEAAMDFDDIRLCLFCKETGLFGEYPEMSGVLYFVEQNALRYLFYYTENPNASQPITMPTGVFPPV